MAQETEKSKFKSSSFHRESLNQQLPKANSTKSHLDSEFIKELVESGKANWKKAPPELKNRYTGIFRILISIPLLAVLSYEIFSRLEGKSVKKMQEGEILPNGDIRKFSEEEKLYREKNSIMYKIFGQDFFLDGFTSRTMRRPKNEEAANDK